MNTELKDSTRECAITLITTAQQLAHLFVCLSKLAYLLGQCSRLPVDTYVDCCQCREATIPALPYFQPLALLCPARSDYSSLSIRELKRLAQGRVRKYSTMTKPQLVLALEAV